MSIRGALAATALLAGVGCGAGPGPAGIGRPWPTPGPGAPNGDDPISARLDLVQGHQSVVNLSMSLVAVYIGDEGSDGVANRDDFLSWVLAGDGYWTLLEQYGVGTGTLVTSHRVSTASFFTLDVLTSGSVSEGDLEDTIKSYASSLYSNGNAFIFFMPTSVGIAETQGGGQASCSAFGGYHRYEGNPALPYAVIAPCPNFPRDMPTSHELVEMATDPFFTGWYDDRTGEEIGDLCNFPVSRPIDLWSPTRFWSNADGACLPP